MTVISLPIFPNRLLKNREDLDEFGGVQIRKSASLGIVELIRDQHDLIFNEDYNPSQNASPYFIKHLQSTIETLLEFLTNEVNKSRYKVVDVGCGKGTFVNLLNKNPFFSAYGFDTSYNGDDPKIQSRYLNKDDIDHSVDLVVLKYVLDYVSPPSLLLNQLKEIFPNAYLYIEGPVFEDTLRYGRFFDICYEQVNYFSKESYLYFFGGRVSQYDEIFGGQYQYVIGHLANLDSNLHIKYDNSDWVNLEFNELFPLMSNQISKIKNATHDKGRIWVWGAGRKGVMFLHHFVRITNLSANKLGCVDLDPSKQGKFTQSTKIPIVSEKALCDRLELRDTLVIANSNYSKEIRKFLAEHVSFSVNVFEL